MNYTAASQQGATHTDGVLFLCDPNNNMFPRDLGLNNPTEAV